ncbi:MAG: hypothetical protein KI790_17010 [Cyclobacteriaceae bacterium]|nr:hypothetical protein [Cyclobacteriaceae bacterium HetDA_MAG_MS6]
MKAILNLIFLALILGLLYLATYLKNANTSVVLSDEALKPDLLLDNSRLYAKENASGRSLEHLDKAIQAMRRIEEELDEESKEIVEGSIADLHVVYDELAADSLVEEDMNYAFSKALNALTLAELKISEVLILSHHSEEARLALKYGMLHVKNAIRYSSGEKRAYETHLYEEIDSLLEDRSLSNEEIIAQIEHMITELDTLVH